MIVVKGTGDARLGKSKREQAGLSALIALRRELEGRDEGADVSAPVIKERLSIRRARRRTTLVHQLEPSSMSRNESSPRPPVPPAGPKPPAPRLPPRPPTGLSPSRSPKPASQSRLTAPPLPLPPAVAVPLPPPAWPPSGKKAAGVLTWLAEGPPPWGVEWAKPPAVVGHGEGGAGPEGV
jgi:hypothetical protein